MGSFLFFHVFRISKLHPTDPQAVPAVQGCGLGFVKGAVHKSFLADIHGFHFRPHTQYPCIESIQFTLNTWVVWSETRQKWWRHLWPALKSGRCCDGTIWDKEKHHRHNHKQHHHIEHYDRYHYLAKQNKHCLTILPCNTLSQEPLYLLWVLFVILHSL